nr:hypothetical protein BaRGS_009089 [Batillaria attramentaria]
MAASPSIKLYYLHLTCRAEVCRLLLAASGVEWEDVRFPYADWPKFKPAAPFGKCPYMDYNGKIYGEAVAIANFLAREFGFAGKTNLESLRIDEVVHLGQDVFLCYHNIFYEEDQTKKAQLVERLKTEDVPRFFGYFERLLKESGTGYFVGDKLTMADFAMYVAVVHTVKGECGVSEADREFPMIRALCSKVEADPNVRKYMDKHKPVIYGGITELIRM